MAEKKTRYTEAQKKSTQKYMSARGSFKVITTLEKKAEYQDAAAATGQSLNQFAITSMDERIKRMKKK